jgi:Tfp pilus assembly protein PilE
VQKGFSFLEITIVIIIISCLFSVVLSARTQVASYEIKKINTHLQEYKLALQSFYNIYGQIAGDTNLGHSFFADQYCSDSNSHFANIRGCNGNNNQSFNIFNNQDKRESILAWYHLYKAGFVIFNNRNDAYNLDFAEPNLSNDCNGKLTYNIENNIPPLKIRQAGVFISKIIKNKQNIQASLINLSGFNCDIQNYQGIFSIKEAQYIDRKYDDGKALTGNFILENKQCLNNDNYNLAYKKSDCKLSYNFILNK